MKKTKEIRYYAIRKEVLTTGIAAALTVVAALTVTVWRLHTTLYEVQGTGTRAGETVIGQLDSCLKEKADCRLCGTSAESVAVRYEGKDSIGIIGLNEWAVLDMEMNTADNDRSFFSVVSGSSFGISQTIESNPSRGMSKAVVSAKEQLDTGFIKNHLCQDCLDKITATLVSQGDCNPFVLVDFTTLEVYGMQKENLGYFVRDYWVDITHGTETVVKAYYVPEKESKR